MLRLGKQIHRHPVGIRRAVGDYQHFGRPGHHVDADHTEHPALGRCDIGVAGTDDLVHLRHRLGAIGQCAHRLRAADGEHPVDAREMRGRQHQRIAFAVWAWHHHDQLADSGHLGRHGVHQHGAGIGGLAAGDIEADAIERRHLLP